MVIDSKKEGAPRWRSKAGLRLTAVLMAAVLAVNVAAIWSIVAARRSAQEAAQAELALSTAAHARSLEAVLATLRGDLIFLSQSAPLVRYPRTAGEEDPLVRRWGRLDVEGTLLLFLEAHPAVERLVMRDPAGTVLAAAGRREGAPALLSPDHAEAPGPPPGLWPSAWPVGAPEQPSATLSVWTSPERLVALAAPADAERLRLELTSSSAGPANESDSGAASGRRLIARAEVADPHWQPPIRWTLERAERGSRLIESVESLAARYRRTVALNAAIITLSLGLGLVAFRQARRSARLTAAAEQQARVRELERQLFHSERLASVGRLAAGLAHEINNPLEGMTNYLSLLREDLTAGRVEEASELVEPLAEGVTRVAGILHQVLTFADPGRTPKTRLDLAEVIRRTAAFVRANPAHRGVAIAVDLPDRPLPVVGNEVTLGQLLLNLLVNACQAQPGGGEVEVSARSSGERVELTVADRGPGLAPEIRERVFEPFQSTRGSTGLGLAVCHGIAADHGGEISAAGRTGGGSVFRVDLPLAAGGDAGEIAERKAPRRASGGGR